MRGVVVAFDEHAGLGEVSAGGTTYSFHCTQIEGGARRIEVGTQVRFCLLAARGGRWEAAALEPLPGQGGGRPRQD